MYFLPSHKDRFWRFRIHHWNWAVKYSGTGSSLSKTNTSQDCVDLHYVTSATYHFLQAINKVTDNDTEAFELLEHGAKFLTGAFAHFCTRLVRLLTDNVCSDGGTHVHNFCALAHNIIIWRGKKKKETLGKQNEWATQTSDGKHVGEIWWLKHKDSDFLFSCRHPKDHNNAVITMFIMFPKTDVQSAVFYLKNVSVWNGDSNSFHQRWQQGWLWEGVALQSLKNRNLGVLCVKPRCCHKSPRPFR